MIAEWTARQRLETDLIGAHPLKFGCVTRSA
jgi:hypothetical protein